MTVDRLDMLDRLDKTVDKTVDMTVDKTVDKTMRLRQEVLHHSEYQHDCRHVRQVSDTLDRPVLENRLKYWKSCNFSKKSFDCALYGVTRGHKCAGLL